MWGVIFLWFWFLFPWWSVMLSIFSCVHWPSVCLLWKNVQIFGPFFNQTIYLFLLLSCMSFLNIFLILTPYWVCNLQIFSPIWLSFHFVKSFLCCAETFSLMQFIFALGAKKNHCHVWYQRVWHLCFLLGVCGIRCYIQVFNPFWINF